MPHKRLDERESLVVRLLIPAVTLHIQRNAWKRFFLPLQDQAESFLVVAEERVSSSVQ